MRFDASSRAALMMAVALFISSAGLAFGQGTSNTGQPTGQTGGDLGAQGQGQQGTQGPGNQQLGSQPGGQTEHPYKPQTETAEPTLSPVFSMKADRWVST